MAVPTDEQLVKRLHELMSEGDLATATIRSLITSLEDDYGISLEERKALLRQEVKSYIMKNLVGKPASSSTSTTSTPAPMAPPTTAILWRLEKCCKPLASGARPCLEVLTCALDAFTPYPGPALPADRLTPPVCAQLVSLLAFLLRSSSRPTPTTPVPSSQDTRRYDDTCRRLRACIFREIDQILGDSKGAIRYRTRAATCAALLGSEALHAYARCLADTCHQLHAHQQPQAGPTSSQTAAADATGTSAALESLTADATQLVQEASRLVRYMGLLLSCKEHARRALSAALCASGVLEHCARCALLVAEVAAPSPFGRGPPGSGAEPEQGIEQQRIGAAGAAPWPMATASGALAGVLDPVSFSVADPRVHEQLPLCVYGPCLRHLLACHAVQLSTALEQMTATADVVPRDAAPGPSSAGGCAGAAGAAGVERTGTGTARGDSTGTGTAGGDRAGTGTGPHGSLERCLPGAVGQGQASGGRLLSQDGGQAGGAGSGGLHVPQGTRVDGNTTALTGWAMRMWVDMLLSVRERGQGQELGGGQGKGRGQEEGGQMGGQQGPGLQQLQVDEHGRGVAVSGGGVQLGLGREGAALQAGTFEDMAVRRRWVRLPLESIKLPGQGAAGEAAGAGDVAALGTAAPRPPRPAGPHAPEDGAGRAPAEPEYALSPGLVFGLCLKTVSAGTALRPWLGAAAGVEPRQGSRDRAPGRAQAGLLPPVSVCSPRLLLLALAASRLVALQGAQHAAAAAAAAAAAVAAACEGDSARVADAGARLGQGGAARGSATGAGEGAEARGSVGLGEARRQCNAARRRLRCWWEATLGLVGRAVRDGLHGEAAGAQEVEAWGRLSEVLETRCLAAGVRRAGEHGAGVLVTVAAESLDTATDPGPVEAGAGVADMDVQEAVAAGWLPCIELLMRKAAAGEQEQDSGSGSSSGGGGGGGKGGASAAGGSSAGVHFPLDCGFLVPGLGEEGLRGLLLGALAAHGPPARVFSLLATLAKVVRWRVRGLQAAALRAAAGEASIEELRGAEESAFDVVLALLDFAGAAALEDVVVRLRPRAGAVVSHGEQAAGAGSSGGLGTRDDADVSCGPGRTAGGQLGSGGSGKEVKVEAGAAVAASDGRVQAVLCGMLLLWREARDSLERLCATCDRLVRMSQHEAVDDLARRVGVHACTRVCSPLAHSVWECATALSAVVLSLRCGVTRGSVPNGVTHGPAQSAGQRQEGQERQEQQGEQEQRQQQEGQAQKRQQEEQGQGRGQGQIGGLGRLLFAELDVLGATDAVLRAKAGGRRVENLACEMITAVVDHLPCSLADLASAFPVEVKAALTGGRDGGRGNADGGGGGGYGVGGLSGGEGSGACELGMLQLEVLRRELVEPWAGEDAGEALAVLEQVAATGGVAVAVGVEGDVGRWVSGDGVEEHLRAADAGWLAGELLAAARVLGMAVVGDNEPGESGESAEGKEGQAVTPPGLGVLPGWLGGMGQQLRLCSNPLCVNVSEDGEVEQLALGLKACARCGGAWYCCRECQVAHWKEGGHREACGKPGAGGSGSG